MDPKRSREEPATDEGMMPSEPVAYPKLPQYGKLRGKKVLLSEAPERLSQADLEQIEVDMPGQGIVRPWRFQSDEVRTVDGELAI